jgi:hypothetical protein
MEMQTWRGGWDRATDATEALRSALEGIGVRDGDAARIRPVVSGRGTPWVDVGMVPASLAEAIAEVIRTGTLERSGQTPRSHPSRH